MDQSLRDAAGRLTAGERAPSRIRLLRHTSISFASYTRLEHDLLTRLMAGGTPLGEASIAGVEWLAASSARLLACREDDVYDAALRYFGHALRGAPLDRVERPWASYFDPGRFVGVEDQASLILGDWMADEVWSLAWTSQTALVFGFDLQARYLGARWIVEQRIGVGASECAAGAEAAFVAELVGRSEVWRALIRDIAPTLSNIPSLFSPWTHARSRASQEPGE